MPWPGTREELEKVLGQEFGEDHLYAAGVYLRQRLEEMEKYAVPDDSDRLAFKAMTRQRRAARREAVRERNIRVIVTTKRLAPLISAGALPSLWVDVPASTLLAFPCGGVSGGNGGGGAGSSGSSSSGGGGGSGGCCGRGARAGG